MNFIPFGGSEKFIKKATTPFSTPRASNNFQVDNRITSNTNRKRLSTSLDSRDPKQVISVVDSPPKRKKLLHDTPKQRREFTGPAIIRLHDEIKAFYENALPTADEANRRERVVAKITQVVKNRWSGAKVELFGSYVTGLYLPTSDIDVVVFGSWHTKPLFTLKEELVKAGVCTEDTIQVLDKASVPIVKITERSTQIKVDVAFNMTNGLTTAKLILGYMEEFPALSYMVMTLKQFLFQRDLNEVYTGGLSSYSLILLIVSYFQMQCRGEGRRKDVNYGVLLMEFFELYGINFNYNQIGICVRDGGQYVKKPEGESVGQLTLYIEDPTSTDNNVGRGTYNLIQIQTSFAYAYHVLSRQLTAVSPSSANLLSSIIPPN